MSGQSSQSMDRPEVEIYFCVLCPEVSEVLCYNNKTELETHLRDRHLKECSSEESHAIDLWIERHIKYQESLNKSMSQTIKTVPDRNKTIYRGCPVCDRIIKVFDIQSEPYPKGRVTHELLVRDINVDYSGNNVNHINPHLKYYPFECLICREECEKSRRRGDPDIKEVVKTSVKPMMRRHIIDRHLKSSPLTREAFEEEVERAILTLKVMVLEGITRKHNTVITRPPIKRRKIQSTPGPLRSSTNSHQLKRVQPILPTFILGTNDYLIPMASVVPNSIISSIPQPLMTSTPIPESQYQLETELDCFDNFLSNSNQSDEESDSSSEESDSQLEVIKDESEVFGCVFCLKRYQNYEKVFEHYLLHFNAFIECSECDLKFKTIVDYRSHNGLHNQKCNLLNVNQFKSVRKWTEKFLDFLKNDRQTLFALTLDVSHTYCAVCLMVSSVYKFESKKVLSENETIESHIHNHMNYFPFECIDCNYDDIKTQFSLDSKAKKHLLEKHDIKNAETMTLTELTTYFVNNNNSINRLDQLIQQSVEITQQINEFNIKFENFGLNSKQCIQR